MISDPYGSTTEKFTTSEIFGRGTDYDEVDGDDHSDRYVDGDDHSDLKVDGVDHSDRNVDGDDHSDRNVNDTGNKDHGSSDGYPVDEFGKRQVAGHDDNGTGTDGGPEEGGSTYGQHIGWKIEMLVGIVAREHLRCGHGGCNVLNMADPLRVKNAVSKVTKQNFVAFKDARLRGASNGSLEYLSLDRDSVRAVCRFPELVANGTYKTNVPNAHGGRFVVTVNQVHVNVTARFNDHRRGHGFVEPDAVTAGAVTVTAEAGADQSEVDAVRRSVDAKYRSVLIRAAATDLRGSTRKGMVARLKTEMKIPISSATGPLPVDGTYENGLQVRMSVSFNHSRARQNPSSGHRGHVNSVTYALTTEREYEMRFDVHVNHLRWTSDLAVTTPDGRAHRWPSVEFTTDDLRIHVTAVMFTAAADRPRSCRRIDAKVRTKDLRFELPSGSTTPDVAVSGDKLARFVERALETQVMGSLTRDLCHDRIDA